MANKAREVCAVCKLSFGMFELTSVRMHKQGWVRYVSYISQISKGWKYLRVYTCRMLLLLSTFSIGKNNNNMFVLCLYMY